MEPKIIKSFLDLHEKFEEIIGSKNSQWIYRGVRSARFELIPKVGRSQRFNLVLERQILTLFKKQATPFLERYPKDEWEWLAIAQHHGLPTRLLDWSANPLIAAFFSVDEECDDESAIYAMPAPKIIDTENETDPFLPLEDIAVLQTHDINRRIAAQNGMFTVHFNPQRPIGTTEGVVKFIIPNYLRREIKRKLWVYGVHYGSLFPDLDGQARVIEYVKLVLGF